MLFFLAIAMGFAGFALLVLGQVKLPGGRLLKALPGRVAGLIFLLFVPLPFVLRALVEHLDLRVTLNDDVQSVINWALFCLCLFGGCFLILRASRAPKRELRRPRLAGQSDPAALFADTGAAPFADTEAAPEVAPKPRTVKGKRPAPAPRPEQNPFDFS